MRGKKRVLAEPSAGNPQVQFDERGGETGPQQAGMRRRRESTGHRHRKPTATAPLLDSTLVMGTTCTARSDARHDAETTPPDSSVKVEGRGRVYRIVEPA